MVALDARQLGACACVDDRASSDLAARLRRAPDRMLPQLMIRVPGRIVRAAATQILKRLIVLLTTRYCVLYLESRQRKESLPKVRLFVCHRISSLICGQ